MYLVTLLKEDRTAPKIDGSLIVRPRDLFPLPSTQVSKMTTNPTSLLDLIGQYPVLEALASYLSTVDLVRLGATGRRAHALVLASPDVFAVLKRQCLCDGQGLQGRLADNEAGINRHRPPPPWRGWCGTGACRPTAEDELYAERMRARPDPDPLRLRWRRWEEVEVEVRLYARRCDAAAALPCLRCGVNVCEECRDYPRVLPDLKQWPNRRPHFRADGRHENVLCMCPPCDAAAEAGLQGRFLDPGLCDCDRYRRWICRACVDAEAREAAAYLADHSHVPHDFEELLHDSRQRTKEMPGGTNGRWPLWLTCPCGAAVPENARFRCTWCMRRHRPEHEWWVELREAKAAVPSYVDDGGCYPMYSPHLYAGDTYPALAYDGPIYRNAGRRGEADGRVTEEAGTSTQGE